MFEKFFTLITACDAKKLIATMLVTVLFSACASGPKQVPVPDLKQGMSRIELERSNRIPSLTKERWFGHLVRISDATNNIIYENFSNSPNTDESSRVRSKDLAPGRYKVLVQCESHASFKGSGSAAVVSTNVVVNADDELRLACELYKPENNNDEYLKTRKTANRAVKNVAYSVRVIELSR